MGLADSIFDDAVFDDDLFDGYPVGVRVTIDSTIEGGGNVSYLPLLLPFVLGGDPITGGGANVVVDSTIAVPIITIDSTIEL